MRTTEPERSPNVSPRVCEGRRGEGRVKIAGRWVGLGAPAGSDEAEAARDAAVEAWRTRRASGHQREPDTVTDLAELYLGFARAYYAKNGRVTTSFDRARDVLQRLVDSGLADAPPSMFGISQLRAFQRWAVADGRWGRASINTARTIVVQMFRWGGEEGLCDPMRWQVLHTVRPLRRGRSPAAGLPPAREGRRVTAAPPQHVEAVVAIAPPAIAAMIRVQLLTAMRPGEVCAMRPCDISPWPGSNTLHLYRVPDDASKLHHIEQLQARVVPIGPRAWEIIEPWLSGDPEEAVYSPRKSEGTRLAAIRAARATPRWGGSHDPDVRRSRRGRPRELEAAYSVASYRRRITACCERAGVPPWSPNQLRHAGCTAYAEAADLLTAQALLGHASSRTTERYTHARLDRAAEAVSLYG